MPILLELRSHFKKKKSIFHVSLKVWLENRSLNNSLKPFFRSFVNGADVGGSICEFFVYMDTDFGRSRWEGIFLYSG